MNAAFLHGIDFGRSGSLTSADDGAGMAHSSARRSSQPSDEANDWFIHVVGYPGSGLFLGIAAYLTDHDNRFGCRIVIEGLEAVEKAGAIDRITADTDTGGLSHAECGELVDNFVGQCARARNYADRAAGEMNGAWHNTYLAFTGGDDSGAVGPDQSRAFLRKIVFYAQHIHDRNALGDADN